MDCLEHERILIFGVMFSTQLETKEVALKANYAKIGDAEAFFTDKEYDNDEWLRENKGKKG
jgi:hypothetical protein